MNGGMWCFAVLIFLNLLVAFCFDGKPKGKDGDTGMFGVPYGHFNFKFRLIDTLILVAVLYWAGLFDKLFT